MINHVSLLCEFGAIACGASVLGRLAVKRPASVPHLVERVDMQLARKICSLAEDRFSESVWIRLCTAGSMWHMLAQARLLIKIVIELRKELPGIDHAEPAIPLRPMLKALRYAGLLSFLEFVGKRPPIHGREFCEKFAKAFYLVEAAIESAG